MPSDSKRDGIVGWVFSKHGVIADVSDITSDG